MVEDDSNLTVNISMQSLPWDDKHVFVTSNGSVVFRCHVVPTKRSHMSHKGNIEPNVSRLTDHNKYWYWLAPEITGFGSSWLFVVTLCHVNMLINMEHLKAHPSRSMWQAAMSRIQNHELTVTRPPGQDWDIAIEDTTAVLSKGPNHLLYFLDY